MGDGAWGISTGLKYLPGAYSETPEVVALSKVAADSGGIYTSHLREEGLGLFEGVGEALEIGRQARIPIVLTHHKAVGQAMWGKSALTLGMVDSARRAWDTRPVPPPLDGPCTRQLRRELAPVVGDVAAGVVANVHRGGAEIGLEPVAVRRQRPPAVAATILA